MIKIKDIKSLTFIKVRPYSITFEIDGKGYLLHDADYTYIELYRKEKYECKVEKIDSKFGVLERVFKSVYHMKKKGSTYKQIDKYMFIEELKECGFFIRG